MKIGIASLNGKNAKMAFINEILIDKIFASHA